MPKVYEREKDNYHEKCCTFELEWFRNTFVQFSQTAVNLAYC